MGRAGGTSSAGSTDRAEITDKTDLPRKTCFVDFHDTCASIICFSENRLLSANTFPAADPHDVSYFIASIWEKLTFNQSSDRLYLSGGVEYQKPVVDTLKKLIRHVEYVALNPNIMLTDEQKRILPTDLLAALCE